MKVNLDLTATAAENLISDELHNNVGAAAFNLDHDFFYGGTELEIWTGTGKSGTQLIENTDYTLAGIDSNLTARAGRNVYTTVTIDNVTYQTGNLYFTYQATADYVDADDRYKVVRASGQSWELTSSGAFEIYTTDTTADSIKIDTLGGLDIDTNEGWYIYDDSGAGLYCSITGDIMLNSASGSTLTLQALGIGNVEIKTPQTGNIIIESNNTSIATIDIDSAGGIDVDSVLGIHIKDLYSGTGTGNGITLLADNDNASGTGGNLTLQTAASSGTAGNIIIDGASGINLKTATTTRVAIATSGDTVFYGTASTTGALPVITLDQADVDKPFIKVIGDAALADLTRNIVDTGDVVTPTIVGYLKIEILDDGDQISDGDYYVPFYSLA